MFLLFFYHSTQDMAKTENFTVSLLVRGLANPPLVVAMFYQIIKTCAASLFQLVLFSSVLYGFNSDH